MNPLEIAHRYFDAWNRHDPSAIVATFAPGGTYLDPTSGGELTGDAIGAYAGGLIAAFPDLAFDVPQVVHSGDGAVAAQWVMRGTNTGPLAGNPPTGRAIEVAGADFITVEDAGIRSVRGYFDQKGFLEQLGLQVIVQPHAIGPVAFGTAVYVQPGNTNKPGALSLTALQVRSDQEVEAVRDYSQRITGELLGMPGFISSLLVTVGHRMFTLTAWVDVESSRQLVRGGTHQVAMQQFFGPDFTAGGQTGVWSPERLNRMWIRCGSCGKMTMDEGAERVCSCGHPLPDPLPFL